MPHNWTLEERQCRCGCGKSFRVLPTSKAQYASYWHEFGYGSYYEFDLERRTSQGFGSYYADLKQPDEILIEKEELL